MAEFSLVPIGVGVSVSRYVALCHDVLEERGLDHELHANGTNVTGEWDDVVRALRECHERVHAAGAPRIQTIVKLGTRTDRGETFTSKVESVVRKRETRTGRHESAD